MPTPKENNVKHSKVEQRLLEHLGQQSDQPRLTPGDDVTVTDLPAKGQDR